VSREGIERGEKMNSRQAKEDKQSIQRDWKKGGGKEEHRMKKEKEEKASDSWAGTS